MADSENPFASPLAGERAADVPETDVERIRREYLKHEAAVKSIGIIFLLGAVVLTFAVVGMTVTLVTLLTTDQDLNAGGVALFMALYLFVLGVTVLQYWTAIGVRRLKKSARLPGIALAAIGILGSLFAARAGALFPVLINGYILYLLASKKGRYVMSPEYRDVIEQTPHIKYKTSIVVWIFVGLVVFVIMLAVIAWLASRA